MKRLVVIGTSLGMPRPKDGIPYEKTYPYLLQKALPDWEIIRCNKRGNRMGIQMDRDHLHDDLIYLNPDYIVVNMGIVDCAPRLFSEKQKSRLKKLHPGLRRRIISFKSKRRLFFTRYFPKALTSLNEFQKAYPELIRNAVEIGAKPILVSIADTSESNKKRSFGFVERMAAFNKVIYDTAEKYNTKLIDNHELSKKHEGFMLEDGIHLSELANKLLAEAIVKKLKEDAAS